MKKKLILSGIVGVLLMSMAGAADFDLTLESKKDAFALLRQAIAPGQLQLPAFGADDFSVAQQASRGLLHPPKRCGQTVAGVLQTRHMPPGIWGWCNQ